MLRYQVTKTVETKDERAKLMFRMKLKVDPQVLQTYYTRVKTGVRGLGFVRTKPDVQWPADLQVKLPKAPAPAASGNAAPQAAAPGAPADDKAPQVAAPAGQASDSKATETKTPEAK